MKVNEIITEGANDNITIEITVVAADEHNFMDSAKEFSKLKFTKPKHTGSNKMVATVSGKKRDLLNYLSADDGPGYSLSYIKKNYPQVTSN